MIKFFITTLSRLILFIIVVNSAYANETYPPAYYHVNNWEVENVMGKTIIKDIGLDANGKLLIVSNVGLKYFDGESFKDVYGDVAKFKNNFIINLEVASNGFVWGLNQLGLLQYFNQKVLLVDQIINFNINNSLAISSIDEPWFISSFKIMKLLDGKKVHLNPSIKATSIAKGSDGKNMLIGLHGGYVKVDFEGNVI